MRHVFILVAVVGCGKSFTEPVSSADAGDTFVDGFSPPAVTDGFERYITPIISNVAPGADLNYCQWVADPDTVDRQVVDFKHYQSLGGHHEVLYATTKIAPIGTTEICSVQDMLNVNFLGGGEGTVTSAVDLPGGYAFALPAGSGLMVNAHYLNSTDQALNVQSVADVKFGDPANPLKPAGFVAVNYDEFMIPANSVHTEDAYCTAPRDLSFFLWGNHMHQWGMAETTELIHAADGTHTMMENSPSWSAELTYNTPWINYGVTTPFIVKAGDTFHLSCTWNNNTDSPILFPTEMCVGTGFTLEAMPQAVCEAAAQASP